MRSRFEPFLNELRRDWGLPVFDARRWLDDDEFVDGQHMVPEAAARFTDRFAQEIMMPFLKELDQARMLAHQFDLKKTPSQVDLK
jgi:hypothetical protein